MQKKADIWYRVGYALETAKSRMPKTKAESGKKLAKRDDSGQKVLDALLTVGAGSVIARGLSLWPGRRRPGVFSLFRAGAAGAAAAFLAELIRPALTGSVPKESIEDELTDILLSGAGRGLLYGAVVEPRIPGPALLRGTAYAALEYALVPWGGLQELTGSAAPHRRIPVLSVLLQPRDPDEQFLEHLVFGIALALLSDY
jgi:hypothetical protein